MDYLVRHCRHHHHNDDNDGDHHHHRERWQQHHFAIVLCFIRCYCLKNTPAFYILVETTLQQQYNDHKLTIFQFKANCKHQNTYTHTRTHTTIAYMIIVKNARMRIHLLCPDSCEGGLEPCKRERTLDSNSI